MVYIFKQGNEWKYERVLPSSGEFIAIERMIPRPVENGYRAVLKADIATNKVWYELEAIPSVIVEPTSEELLAQAKNQKVNELIAFDSSEDVNDCVIVYQGHTLHYWASKDERNDLKNAVRDCISVGRDEYRLDLRDKGISIPLKCEVLLQMLAALEVYAIDCYNKTTDHEYAIRALTTLEEVESYNFKVGYPEKLRFEV